MQPPDGTPVYLHVQDGWKKVNVFLDGIFFGSTRSFNEAFLYGTASFAVFNLSYPCSMAKTFLFMEKAVFNIDDCTTIKTKKQLQTTKAVVSFIAKLNATVKPKEKAGNKVTEDKQKK